MTQTQLADACGTSLRMIQYLEKGDRQITDKWVKRLVAGFHTAGHEEVRDWWFLVDPKAVPSEDDMKIISLYRALSDEDRQQVDNILYREQEI